jgi:hypothetical protein
MACTYQQSIGLFSVSRRLRFVIWKKGRAFLDPSSLFAFAISYKLFL